MAVQLHCLQRETRFVHQVDGAAASEVCLPVGMPALAGGLLARFPPDPVALERAIAEVEEALMPQVPALRAWLPEPVQVPGDVFDMLSARAWPAHPQQLTVDEIERLFNRLTAVAEGTPAHREDIPDDAQFVAALLVLREIMHHVGYPAVERQA